jgi:hypothetical protein
MHSSADSVVARKQNDKKSHPEDSPNKAKQAASTEPSRPYRSNEKIAPHDLSLWLPLRVALRAIAAEGFPFWRQNPFP